jgi:hypothetical protein
MRNRLHFLFVPHLYAKSRGYSAVIDSTVPSHNGYIFITAPVTNRSHNFACTADNEPAFVGLTLRP